MSAVEEEISKFEKEVEEVVEVEMVEKEVGFIPSDLY